MSGGYFDYSHYSMINIAESLEEIIKHNTYEYDKETIDKIKQTITALHETHNMVHRIDYLLSYDDSEESFHQRWKEDVDEMTPLLICNLCEQYSIGPKGVFCGATSELLDIFTDLDDSIFTVTPKSCPCQPRKRNDTRLR